MGLLNLQFILVALAFFLALAFRFLFILNLLLAFESVQEVLYLDPTSSLVVKGSRYIHFGTRLKDVHEVLGCLHDV